MSLAKHCAKKLPPSTAVVAVDNGKVIFQRSAAKKLAGSNVNMNFQMTFDFLFVINVL